MNQQLKLSAQFISIIEGQNATQIAQFVLQINNYTNMAGALEYLNHANIHLWNSTIAKLKQILIVQPEQIYTDHNYLNFDKLWLIRDIFKGETQISQQYFQSHSCFIQMAVAEGFLLQNLSAENVNKLKQVFGRKLRKQTSSWGLSQLQNLQSYIMDKSTGYFPGQSPIHHERQLDRISYFYSFYQNYPQIFSQLIDVGSITFKMMLCLREEKQRDKSLSAKLKEIYFKNRYHIQTTTKNIKFSLQFFKNSFNEKQCLYSPKKSLQSILSYYNTQEIEMMITNTSIGGRWQDKQVSTFFLNCILLGFSEISVSMMISLIKFCEKLGKTNHLLFNYQQNMKKIFIFMKHHKFYNNCLKILKYFIYSAPPTLTLFQIFLPEAVNLANNLKQFQQRFSFFNMLQVVAFHYKSITSVEQINKLLEQHLSTEVNRLTQEEIKNIIEQYSWKKGTAVRVNQKNIVAKQTSNYKGLSNIGNSCYMNSFIQSLYMNKEFQRAIINASTLEIKMQKLKDTKYENKSKEFAIKEIQQFIKPFAELQKIFALLLRSNRPDISPANVRATSPEMFRNTNQHDTIQFGRALLQSVFKSIPQIFQGEVTNEILCKLCNQIRERKEVFLDYHIAIDQSNVEDLIKSSFKPQIVQNLTCDHCLKKGEESIKRHYISKHPNYLIISINRFEYDITQKRNKKNKVKIMINQIIAIGQVEYELYSIIVHTGPSPNAGHYFSFSKVCYENPSRWVCHNDSIVSDFQSYNQVNNFLQNNEEDTPYILFYEKKQYIQQMKQQLTKPITLRQPQQNFVKKDNENYVNSQKKVAFQLKPVDYSLFLKKDDEDDQSNGGGFYNSYVS